MQPTPLRRYSLVSKTSGRGWTAYPRPAAASHPHGRSRGAGTTITGPRNYTPEDYRHNGGVTSPARPSAPALPAGSSTWAPSGRAWPSRTRWGSSPPRSAGGALPGRRWCRRLRARARRRWCRRCWPTSPAAAPQPGRAAARASWSPSRAALPRVRRPGGWPPWTAARLGDRVGYTVRGERQAGPGTVIEFVTPGILLRRLLADPGLESSRRRHPRRSPRTRAGDGPAARHARRGPPAARRPHARRHVRHAGRAALRRPDRRGGRRGEHDGGGPAPVVDCPSALYPLEVDWAPAAVPRLDERGVTRAFLDHVADTAAAAHAAALAPDQDIDALVFVPGAWEVSYVAARLRGRVGRRGPGAPRPGRPGGAGPRRLRAGARRGRRGSSCPRHSPNPP